MSTIKTINRNLPELKKKNVCAYARVSCDKESMLVSLMTQVKYFSEKIQSNSQWNYVGVYSDYAKTGTKATRGDFEKMFADAYEGRIDIILVKAISRFARNTLDTLRWIRAMKEINVDIYFEEENIHTLSSQGELLITLLASSAQEQSRTCSLNMLWRVRHNFEQGIPCGGDDCLGYNLIGHQYVVVPKEAEIVKRIYQLYLDGNGYSRIARMLNADGLTSKAGMPFQTNTVKRVLTNYAYTGNMILQKTYRPDYLTKKKRTNHGEKNQYLVEETHEAIIDMETFEKVQMMIKSKEPKKSDTKTAHSFAGMIRCCNCGKLMKYHQCKYHCPIHVDLGTEHCDMKPIPEDALIEALSPLLKVSQFTEEAMRGKISSIIARKDNNLEVHMKDGSIKTIQWKNRSRSSSWTPEMKQKARERAIRQRGKTNG